MKGKIGQTIARWRKEKGLTLRELDAATGLNYRTICLWESGKGDIGVESFIKIAQALGQDPCEILSGSQTDVTP